MWGLLHEDPFNLDWLPRDEALVLVKEEPEDKVQEAVDTVTRMETEMVEMRREATDLKAQVFELLTTAKILEMKYGETRNQILKDLGLKYGETRNQFPHAAGE